jgi:hypothetical protein
MLHGVLAALRGSAHHQVHSFILNSWSQVSNLVTYQHQRLPTSSIYVPAPARCAGSIAHAHRAESSQPAAMRLPVQLQHAFQLTDSVVELTFPTQENVFIHFPTSHHVPNRYLHDMAAMIACYRCLQLCSMVPPKNAAASGADPDQGRGDMTCHNTRYH